METKILDIIIKVIIVIIIYTLFFVQSQSFVAQGRGTLCTLLKHLSLFYFFFFCKLFYSCPSCSINSTARGLLNEGSETRFRKFNFHIPFLEIAHAIYRSTFSVCYYLLIDRLNMIIKAHIAYNNLHWVYILRALSLLACIPSPALSVRKLLLCTINTPLYIVLCYTMLWFLYRHNKKWCTIMEQQWQKLNPNLLTSAVKL
jgi:hypothetical protein